METKQLMPERALYCCWSWKRRALLVADACSRCMEVAELLLILTILVSSAVKVFVPLHPIKACVFPSKSHGPLKLSRFSEQGGSHTNVVHGSGLEADVAEINGDWDHSLEGDREEDDLGPLFASFFYEEFADPGG